MNKGQKIKIIESHLRNFKTYQTAVLNCKKQLEYLLPSMTANYSAEEGKATFTVYSSTEKSALDRLESKKALDLHEEIAKYNLLIEIIEAGVNELKPNEAKFVELRYFENKTIDEVTKVMKYSEKNVFKIRNQALNRLVISLVSVVHF